MGAQLIDSAYDVTTKTLRSVNHSDKLDSEKAGSTLRTGAGEVLNAAKDVHNNRQRRQIRAEVENNMATAAEVMINTSERNVIELGDRVRFNTLSASDSEGANLYTASRRRTRSKAYKEGRNSSVLTGLDDVNAKKLHDNRKKMQSKLRQNYEVKTRLKGGLNNELVVEKSVQNRLSDTLRYKDVAGSIGEKTLHFLDDVTSSGDDNSTQNAWVDTIGKGSDITSRVFSISQTAKYWRLRKTEKDITKLVRQEEKIIENNIRLEYRSALNTARQSELWKRSNFVERRLQKKAIKKRYMKNAIKEYQKAKKAGETARITYTTGFSLKDKAKTALESLAKQVVKFIKSPIAKIALAILMSVTMLTTLVGTAGTVIMLSLCSQSSSVPAGGGFPKEVEQWREFVAERMTEYKHPEFVNAILVTIWQESGGVSESSGGDIMQCKESGYWSSEIPANWNSFTTEQKSIDAGCRYFIAGLDNWKVTEANDYDGLQVVAQGYNYGWGFLDYMRSQKADKWTIELSGAYSDKRAASLGWSSYGHKPYGEEWLKKYMQGGLQGSGEIVVEKGAGGVVKTAQGQIGITEDPAGSNNVIYNTEYYGHEVSETPDGKGGYSTCTYPWCCAFVWWVFQKSGNGDAFYGGGKVASCSSVHTWAKNNGRMITGKEAGYGDIVLFGSDEHIEIVVANNGDGTYTTIGGNTSSEDSGSQSNGGGVFVRKRSTSGKFPITSFIRPKY